MPICVWIHTPLLFLSMQRTLQSKFLMLELMYFDVLHHQVAVKDERLAEAIASLPCEKRDIILLSYFLDMNDREIADTLNMVKRTVQRKRTSSIKELKLRLEVKEDGQDAE